MRWRIKYSTAFIVISPFRSILAIFQSEIFRKENTDLNIVSLIALLHDVDDYKLFGKEYSNNLINAKKIMNNAKVPLEIQSIVLSELSCIWYKTDTRALDKTGDDNLFIEACFDFKIARNIDMLLDYLKEL